MSSALRPNARAPLAGKSLAARVNKVRELVHSLGPAVAFLVTGAFVVENLFAIPGIGFLSVGVIDSATISRAKPDPEIFQRAAAALGVEPAACLGIEDAQAGIAAIKSAGMAALGIGDAQLLKQADAVLPDLMSFELDKFVAPT